MSRARDLADGTFSGTVAATKLETVTGADINMDASATGQLQIDGNGYAGAIALNTEGLNLYTNSAVRDLIFGVNETEVARITPDGLTFNGDTDAANALDDYEEGTWSPFWTDSSGNTIFNASPTINFAHYTKVGRYVTASCYFNMPSSFGTTGSYSSGGALRVGGLPFTAYATGSNNYYAGSVGWFDDWSWDAGGVSVPPMIYTRNNTTLINVVYPTTNGVTSAQQQNVYVGSSGIILTATYFTQA